MSHCYLSLYPLTSETPFCGHHGNSRGCILRRQFSLSLEPMLLWLGWFRFEHSAHLSLSRLLALFLPRPRRFERKPASVLCPQPEILSILPSFPSEHTKGELFSFKYLFSCVWVFCLHVYLCTTEGFGLLITVLRDLLSCHVGVGKWTQVLCRSGKYF